jgi:hypothetical protein
VISVWSGLGRGGPVLARWTARQPAETGKPQPAAINALWWDRGSQQLASGLAKTMQRLKGDTPVRLI